MAGGRPWRYRQIPLLPTFLSPPQVAEHFHGPRMDPDGVGDVTGQFDAQ
jgi:hypothetical protein